MPILSRQIPGGAYVNEIAPYQTQIPGGGFINGTVGDKARYPVSPLIISKNIPWTRQPRIASPLAPLWRNNAKFFWSISNDGGVGKDLVSGRTPTVTGTAVRTPTTSGIAHGGGVYYNYSTLGVFSGSTQSWAALVAPEYTANLRSLFSQRDGGSARFDTYFNITEGASTSAGAILCATDGTPTNGWKTTSAFSETAFAVYSFSRDGANGQFYKNGWPITTTQVGTPASVAETQTYLFYQAGFAASFGANSRAIYFLASNARWPDSLHARLANPWDVYAPIARRIWVPQSNISGIPLLTNPRATSITTTNIIPACQVTI